MRMDHSSICVDERSIAGIPLLVVAPEVARPVPVVFFVPGYGGSKEHGLPQAIALARQGVACVSLDPPDHGARDSGGLAQAADPACAVYPPETGLDVWLHFMRTIARTISELSLLREAMAADPRMEPTRCGVTGVSMGGYAAFGAFAADPHMAAGVPMIGLPSFTRRWLDLLDECAFSNDGWAAALAARADHSAEQTAWIRTVDPHDRLAAAAPRALLAMNNDFDTDQPKHYTIELFRTLRPAWAAAGAAHNLRLSIHPHAHRVLPDMEAEAAAWFAGALHASHP